MKTATWAIVLLTLSGGGYLAFTMNLLPSGAPSAADPSTPPPSIEKPPGIQGVGYVEPVSEVRRLSFKVGGVIKSVRVEIGATVACGDILAELDNLEQQQSVLVAEQQLAVAQAERARVLRGVNENEIKAAEHQAAAWRARLELYRKEFQRNESLRQSNAISLADLDRNRMQFEEAQEELARAEAEVAHLRTYVLDEEKQLAEQKVVLAQRQLEFTKTILENTRLVAPMDGCVLEILRREGESVTTDNREPVILFSDASRLRVRAEIDERNAYLIRAGQQVTIFGRNLGDQRYTGRVSIVKRLMGEKTVFARTATERKDLDSVQIFVEFDQPLDVPIGLRVDVAVQIESHNGERKGAR